MYENIGKKIKVLAKVFAIIEAAAAVIAGMSMMTDDDTAFIGFLLMLIGPVIAWVSSWVLYAFGEGVDKLCDIERNTRGGEKKSETQARIDQERVNRLEYLRAQGLITEEEYRQSVSK